MAAGQWWAVFYTEGSAASGKNGPGLLGADTSFIIVQAASSAAARTAAQGQLSMSAAISTVNGPYASQADAESAAGGIQAKAGSEAQSGSLPGGLTAIGDFFSDLSRASTWIRVGQVVLGLILIAVGVARITHAVPVATSIARTAGAVAI